MFIAWTWHQTLLLKLLLLLLLQNSDGSFIYTPGNRGMDDSFQYTAIDW
jgi:hypothetical protein